MTETVARPPLLRHKSSWERIDKSRVSDITLAKVNRNRTIQIEDMYLTSMHQYIIFIGYRINVFGFYGLGSKGVSITGRKWRWSYFNR